MKKYAFVAALVAATCWSVASKPMESVDRYNVVLVHGAADRWQGLDCEKGNPKTGDDYEEAYNTRNGVVTDLSSCRPDTIEVPDKDDSNKLKDSIFTKCDTAYYLPSRIGGKVKSVGDTGSSATGMVKELAPLLRDTILESPLSVYLQRPFTRPAASPADNGDEIGKNSWKGENKCSARRSLIEEAQQFKAKGVMRLDSLRTNSVHEYRSIPSRNILIGHSMGGVAIREYVQGDNYNHDVDKMITLDSPHEGTGALNMLLALKSRLKSANSLKDGALDALIPIGIAMVLDPATVQLGLVTLTGAYLIDEVQVVVDKVVLDQLGSGYDYYEDDALTDYIDPNTDGGVNDLISKVTPDMPMVRLLGGEHSMSFTDPDSFKVWAPLKGFVPDEWVLPVMNAWTYLGESGDKSTDYVNALAGFGFGLAGGVAMMERGTALVPEYSSYGDNTRIFNSPDVDVKKRRYEAAVHAREYEPLEDKMLWEIVAAEFAAANVPLVNALALAGTGAGLGLPVVSEAFIVAMALASVENLVSSIVNATAVPAVAAPSLMVAVNDLKQSHAIPAESKLHKEELGESRTYSKITKSGLVQAKVDSSLLLEDFLYEKPFVNLGLFVSADSLRDVDAGCFYEADKADKEQLCEIGLYGANGDIVDMAGRRNYKEFRKSPLAFKSSSDWEKMGVKVDRWKRVDGLTSGGDLAKNSVPIRHVERYNVPAITVDNWIEKYSFVVDDLMPHRLRQIRLNFNYKEEIAWECDITKADTSSTACQVFGRSGGGSWGPVFSRNHAVLSDGREIVIMDTIRGVPHPVKKNGLFEFEPRKYGFDNLLA